MANSLILTEVEPADCISYRVIIHFLTSGSLVESISFHEEPSNQTYMYFLQYLTSPNTPNNTGKININRGVATVIQQSAITIPHSKPIHKEMDPTPIVFNTANEAKTFYPSSNMSN